MCGWVALKEPCYEGVQWHEFYSLLLLLKYPLHRLHGQQ